MFYNINEIYHNIDNFAHNLVNQHQLQGNLDEQHPSQEYHPPPQPFIKSHQVQDGNPTFPPDRRSGGPGYH